MNVREAMTEREKAKKFFKSLTPSQIWELGEEMVLGTIDYLYWFDGKRPSRAFMNELDYQRILWEDIQNG